MALVLLSYYPSGFAVLQSAELALASVAVSVIAPKMVPGWLSAGDFTALPPLAEPTFILYLMSTAI